MNTLFPQPTEQKQFATELRPRDYQQEAIKNSLKLWDDGVLGTLIRVPTGCGKTLMAAWVMDEWCQRSADHYALVLCHERQLVQQFREELQDVLGVHIGLEMGNDGSVAFGSSNTPQFVVASRQTLYKKASVCITCAGDGCEYCREGVTELSRLFKFDWRKNWLVVVDELHRYKRSMKSCAHIFEWFEQNPQHRRLGLTATPERTDKTSLFTLTPGVAIDYPMYDIGGGRNALDDGWVVPFDQRFIQVEGLDWANIKEVAGDYQDDDLERVLEEESAIRSMIDPMLELVENRPTLIFSPTVAMAKDVARRINAMGGEAEWLSGEVPDELRQDVYARFERGDIQFLSVCGLCREGYNNCSVAAVAVFRPTKSRSLAEQMKGRGVRPLKGLVDGLGSAEERRAAIAASDKPNCLIVDLVGMTGLPPVATTAHLLGTGKPDEVINLANDMALAIDGPADMVDLIEQAEEKLEKQRREAEKREERRQIELNAKREAERRTRLDARVRYSQQQVAIGSDGPAFNAFTDYLPERARDATQKQVNFLVKLGVSPEKAMGFSKRQAGLVIDKLTSRTGGDYIVTLKQHAGTPLRDVPSGYIDWALRVGAGGDELARNVMLMRQESSPIEETFVV